MNRPLLHCEICRDNRSANPEDYWMHGPTHVFKCSACNKLLVLVRPVGDVLELVKKAPVTKADLWLHYDTRGGVYGMLAREETKGTAVLERDEVLLGVTTEEVVELNAHEKTVMLIHAGMRRFRVAYWGDSAQDAWSGYIWARSAEVIVAWSAREGHLHLNTPEEVKIEQWTDADQVVRGEQGSFDQGVA